MENFNIKTIIISLACAIIVAGIISSNTSASLRQSIGETSFNRELMKYCQDKGFSSNWMILMSTTSIGQGSFSCKEKIKEREHRPDEIWTGIATGTPTYFSYINDDSACEAIGKPGFCWDIDF